jgi:hypothetical protein
MNTPTYKGEVMLLRWADSSTGGRTVTFTLEDTPDDPERHPFKGLPCGKDGQRFALVVVPIGEAEHPQFPTEQPKPERPKQSWSSMSRAQQAGVLCSDERFQSWIGVWGSGAEQQAANYVREHCGVGSRSYLDLDGASAKWDQLVTSYRIATGQQAEPR